VVRPEQGQDPGRIRSRVGRADQSGAVLELQDLVFILCADPSQGERCSRVCCNAGIRQAIQAKQLNPHSNITILFRDIYFGGMGEDYENEFHKARKLGITFFRYQKGNRPVIGDEEIDVIDTLTGNRCISPSTGSSSVCP
jgi:heterodisulfide reductase subunit A2